MAYPMTPMLLAAIERQAREQAAGNRAGSEKARQLVAIIDLLRAAEAERDRLRAALERVTVAADDTLHAYRSGHSQVGEERHRLYLAVRNAALAPAE